MSRHWIPDEAIEAAFEWLKQSSEVVAAARVNVLRKEFMAKKVHAGLFRHADGSVEARKAWATDHEKYAQAMEEYFQAVEIWETLQDQRNKCEATIEAWRSQEASQRGVIRSAR